MKIGKYFPRVGREKKRVKFDTTEAWKMFWMKFEQIEGHHETLIHRGRINLPDAE